MELMHQPFTGQLGDRLIALLASPDYHTLNIVVAFAKNSGVLRIKDAIERFRKRGGKVNACVGVDLGGTSYEALTNLLLLVDSLNVVHSEKGQTFHPKIYQFQGQDKGLMIVGSHNLTGGGLWTNFESSVVIPLDATGANGAEKLSGLDEYMGVLASLGDSCMPITAQNDIENLLQNGYVFKEVSEQVRHSYAAKQEAKAARLFGNGAPAKLPRVTLSKIERAGAVSVTPATPISLPSSGKDETIWFETRKMTGGSRNILDLSMKSLVTHGDPTGTSLDLRSLQHIRGSVEFFGLNPTVTNQKNITLNFEGVDYAGNTIFFPDGEKANGTWRLRINGTSLSGQKITDAFRAKGEGNYLVEKVVTFTKVQGDYYFLSVFPEAELENFKKASRILARNGTTPTAKLFGLL